MELELITTYDLHMTTYDYLTQIPPIYRLYIYVHVPYVVACDRYYNNYDLN